MSLSQSGDPQLHGPGPCLPVPIAIAVALHQPRRFFSPWPAPVRAPTSISINRSAAKAIISRSISASGVFSTSERRFIISSVIGGFLGDRLSSQPDPSRKSPVTTARPLPRYNAIESALTRGLAPATPPSGARPEREAPERHAAATRRLTEPLRGPIASRRGELPGPRRRLRGQHLDTGTACRPAGAHILSNTREREGVCLAKCRNSRNCRRGSGIRRPAVLRLAWRPNGHALQASARRALQAPGRWPPASSAATPSGRPPTLRPRTARRARPWRAIPPHPTRARSRTDRRTSRRRCR
jgi:hypothetical protein